jgi:hypothetical protein
MLSPHTRHLTLALVAAAMLAAPGTASADDGANAYAIVVGSNPGGEGQQTLHYAEADANTFADLLTDIGGYASNDITLLEHPTSAQLIDALETVARKVGEDAAAGRQSVLLFYYSGHSKAAALNLGDEELPLATLRAIVTNLPATLTIVILDACQSGEFSNIKGAEPAADFSYNSVSRLDSAGVAVMASSASTELSQESEELGGSYFTHHLMVGLRGAGDADKDGRVSLDEAYSYAYDQTLIATAKTAVGRQHVTLETDLKGKGDVALSFPAKADAHLVLPEELTADVLVRTDRDAVIAEVHKVEGAVSIALPTGSYKVLVRMGKRARECSVTLGPGAPGTIDLATCDEVDLVSTSSKGGGVLLPAERWAIELSGGMIFGPDDAYTTRLETFGYVEDFFMPAHWNLATSYRVTPFLHAVVSFGRLGSETYKRDSDTEFERFSWTSHGLAVQLRAGYPLAGGEVVPFAEAGGGLGFARTTLEIGDIDRVSESHYGYQLTGGIGLQVNPWQRFGFFAKGSFTYAPVIDNLLGDTHDSGGLSVATGIRTMF